MKTKGLILIVIIVVACIGVGAYFLLSGTVEYKNITMNGVVMEVPESNVTVLNQTEHYSIYNDSKNGIAIYVFDSEGSNLGDISEMASYAETRDANQMGAQLQQNNGLSYNYSDTLKQYTYLTNFTHKNVFIVTKNKDDMEHILSTIALDETSITLNIDNATENTTQSTTKTVSKKNTKSDSPDVVSDSWEYNYQADDGSYYRQVEYSDGNFRQINSKGQIIGSSYEKDNVVSPSME